MKMIWRGAVARLTFSNVIAIAALFIALGGASYAAIKIPKSSVGTKQLKKNAVTSQKVKNGSLLKADFRKGQLPAGATGPQGSAGQPGSSGAAGSTGATGPKGATGSSGATGDTGSSASAILTGRSSLGTTDQFISPSGEGTANSASASVDMISPAAPTVARNLTIQLDLNPTLSSRTFTLDVGNTPSALSCTVPASGTVCTDTANSVTVPASSLIVIHSAVGGPVFPTIARFGLTIGGP